VGSATAGASASAGGDWTTWYTQASYQIPTTKLEGVIRYGDFDTPHDSQDQTQWAFGMNYLFAGNIMAKFTYEANDGQAGSRANDDRWLFQMAYGF